MNNSLTALLIIIAILFVIFRQFRARKVSRTGFILLPVIAAYEAFNMMPKSLSSTEWAELGVTALLAVFIGSCQGLFTRLETRSGVLYIKGGLIYFLLWVVLLAGRITIRFIFEGTQGFSNFAGSEWLIFAGIALAWGIRSIVLYRLHPEIRLAFSQMGNRRSEKRRI